MSPTSSRLSADLPILQTVLADRYRLLGELGRGGMARVYLADDLKHDRPVAVKVLRPELSQAEFVERFHREIRAVARLHHAHILPLHDSGQVAGLFYYVMPYVEGETLRERMGREGALPPGEIVRIVCELAEALDYAHRHGFVHRDVKPENVLLEEGHVLLADFGVAIAIGAAAGPRLTAAGLLVGTPAYMSPEQATDSAAIDGRSDLYSLGCIVFEMLAGEPLFTGNTAQEILAGRFRQPAPSLERLPPSTHRGLHQALARALREKPEERHANVREFAQEVASALEESRGARLHAAIRWVVSVLSGRSPRGA